MALKFNPLLRGGFDESKRNLNDLEDVNAPEPIDNGKALTYQSGTWVPETPAGGGDMEKSVYDQLDDGVVDNSERLEGETLGSVQNHNVAAAKITTGTFSLDRIPAVDDARIPNLETLSYGGTFADAQIPNLAASKITTGTFNVNRIDTLDNLKGTITAAKVAALDADKIATGTFGLARVPTMDDAHIPNLDTLSGGVFGTAQIPSIGAYKIASGTLNADRIPALPTTKITSGTFTAPRIPILPTSRYGSAVLVSGTRSMTGDLDFAKHQAKAVAFEVLGSAPASPATAQVYYNSGDDKVYVYVA